MVKKVTCPTCGGTKKCYECKGSGKGYLWGSCSNCDGNKKCPTCDGKGYHFSD